MHAKWKTHGGNPSSLQTTLAELVLNPSPQTGVQLPLTLCSSNPSLVLLALTRRTAPGIIQSRQNCFECKPTPTTEVRLEMSMAQPDNKKCPSQSSPLPLRPNLWFPNHVCRITFRWCNLPAVLSTYIYWFWSPLSPVLFNVCTKGLADLNQNGPSKFLTLVDDGLIYKTSKDSQEATEAVQQQLDSISQWCHDTGSLISPGKAQTLWCTLDNRTEGKPVPAVTLDGAVVERTSYLRYFGIHFDRMLTYRKHVETTAPKCKKGLSVLKAMGYWTTPPLPAVSKCGPQCHWLRTRPHNNVTDKAAKAGQSAEWGNASHTRNHQGHTHWDHEVHARPTTNANQTESGAG